MKDDFGYEVEAGDFVLYRMNSFSMVSKVLEVKKSSIIVDVQTDGYPFNETNWQPVKIKRFIKVDADWGAARYEKGPLWTKPDWVTDPSWHSYLRRAPCHS